MQLTNIKIQNQILKIETRNQEILALLISQSRDIDTVNQWVQENCEMMAERFRITEAERESVPEDSKFYIWENIGLGG